MCTPYYNLKVLCAFLSTPHSIVCEKFGVIYKCFGRQICAFVLHRCHDIATETKQKNNHSKYYMLSFVLFIYMSLPH